MTSETTKQEQHTEPTAPESNSATSNKLDKLNEQDFRSNSLWSETLQTRQDIDLLLKVIRKSQRECSDMENENRYLQDYVGSLVATGSLKK